MTDKQATAESTLPAGAFDAWHTNWPAGATWAGFLAAAFCIVGMMGLFATYAAPLPYQREALREVTLDRALSMAPGQLATLADPLGDSADAVLHGTAPLPARVAAERVAMRARFTAEADQTIQRLRLLIVVFTVVGAVFGAMMLALQRRQASL